MDELRLRDLSLADEPLDLFAAWMQEAIAAEVNDPNAVALATVDAQGMPDVRMVLLKGTDSRGFAFYTNQESVKGGQLAANPQAAFALHWKSLRRQVRARGTIEPVAAKEADAYFASRSRDSRIGAWASRQSRPLESHRVFEDAFAAYDAKYPGDSVPRPPYWIGYRIVPVQLEFWCDRPHRLHERRLFRRPHRGAPWDSTLLYP